jgi:3-oxoacyl-[acyl-carrier protein] reductase
VSRQRQLAAKHVTINNLLPGWFDTDRIRAVLSGAAQKTGTTLEQQYAARLKSIPAGRIGVAEEFGQTCAFLCSQHAGYITGQNILIDGGAYPGTF